MKKTTDQIMPSLYFRLNVHCIGHQATLGYNVQSKVAIVKTMCLPPTYNSKLFFRETNPESSSSWVMLRVDRSGLGMIMSTTRLCIFSLDQVRRQSSSQFR